jgi:hypothetical protein
MTMHDAAGDRAATRKLAAWVLSGALVAAAAGSAAQTAATATAESASPAPEAPAATQTRSLFLGTIAALIAQNVGNGVGAALSAGLSGSITRWFNADAAPAAAAASAATSAQGTPSSKTAKASEKKGKASPAPAELHAGVAFEVHRVDAKGATRAIDPTRHTFRTGDRFQVFYRPSLPGRVKVININPDGKKSRIDAVDVAAGELVTLGPYQFVDRHGTEILRLVLEPCSTPALVASTRSIVKAAVTAPQEPPRLRIRDCADRSGGPMATRSIRKTAVEGSTVYALDRLSADELSSGRVLPRSVQISLKHR